MPSIRIIEGVQCSETGVPLESGIRCPHGVVDGNKPIAQSGPRCLQCRKEWRPAVAKEDLGSGLRDSHFCPTCGERLHITYFPKTVEEYDAEGKWRGSKQVYVPGCWSHEAPNLGCVRSAFPVEGYEEHYNSYGWGRWEEYSARLIKELHDRLERSMRYAENYGSSRTVLA